MFFSCYFFVFFHRDFVAFRGALRCADVTTRVIDRIVDAVETAWSEWQSEEKLRALFGTLSAVLKAVKDAEGGNEFKQPRKV